MGAGLDNAQLHSKSLMMLAIVQYEGQDLVRPRWQWLIVVPHSLHRSLHWSFENGYTVLEMVLGHICVIWR